MLQDVFQPHLRSDLVGTIWTLRLVHHENGQREWFCPRFARNIFRSVDGRHRFQNFVWGPKNGGGEFIPFGHSKFAIRSNTSKNTVLIDGGELSTFHACLVDGWPYMGKKRATIRRRSRKHVKYKKVFSI